MSAQLRTGNPLSFRNYHVRAFLQVVRDIRKALWSNVLPILIAVVISVLQTKFGFIRKDQTWASVLVNASGYIAVLLAYLVYHFVRAPWKLDQERAAEIDRAEAELSEKIREYKSEVNHRLSWRKAGQVDALLNETRCLHSDLSHMLTIAAIPGKADLVLEHPLAEVNFEDHGCQGFPVEVWRFQKQFSAHRQRCADLGVIGAVVKSPILLGEATGVSKSDQVLQMLKQHHALLEHYSDDVTGY